MEEKNLMLLSLVAIVGVVAVVALVALLSGKGQASAVEKGSIVIPIDDGSENSAGQLRCNYAEEITVQSYGSFECATTRICGRLTHVSCSN